MYYLEYFLCLKNTAPRDHPFYTKICLQNKDLLLFHKIQSKIGIMQINVRNSNKCFHTLNKCNLN